MTSIPITRPSFGPDELAAVQEPLRAGWVVQGRFVREFEQAVAGFVGAPHAAAVTSCTTGLHLAVLALGLRPGDEVVVPAFTWISTANAVEYAGARAVFCDVDPTTFNIDPTALAACIGPRTVGVIPVHLFGLAAPMDEVLATCRRAGLWVVEDAACALGTRYRGQHVGALGDLGCFSFHPRKSITTGEGGVVVTRSPDHDRTIRVLRDHGASRSDHERHQAAGGFRLADYDHLGFNYRMTDIQGALGAAQMRRAGELLAARAERARRYDRLLAGLDWLVTPAAPPDQVHGYQAYVCRLAPEARGVEDADRLGPARDRLMELLEARGIAARPGTHAAALTGYYRARYGLSPARFPGAYLSERLSLTLPLWPEMSDAEQDQVCEALRALWPAAREAAGP